MTIDAAAIAGGVVGALFVLALFVIATIIAVVIVMKRRKAVPGTYM